MSKRCLSAAKGTNANPLTRLRSLAGGYDVKVKNLFGLRVLVRPRLPRIASLCAALPGRRSQLSGVQCYSPLVRALSTGLTACITVPRLRVLTCLVVSASGFRLVGLSRSHVAFTFACFARLVKRPSRLGLQPVMSGEPSQYGWTLWRNYDRLWRSAMRVQNNRRTHAHTREHAREMVQQS